MLTEQDKVVIQPDGLSGVVRFLLFRGKVSAQGAARLMVDGSNR